MRATLLTLTLIACEPSETDKSPVDSTGDSTADDSAAPDSPEPDDTDHTGRPDSVHTGESGDSEPDSGPLVEGPPQVVLFIGDGMGFEHVKGGGLFAFGASGSLQMESLPYQGRLRSASLSGITDSAAAATAYAAGTKTWNGVIGQDEHGAELESLLELARARGMAVGVVTTDTLTGATPASFMAHVEDRGMSSDIAEQIAADVPDVLMGGGRSALDELVAALDVQLVSTAAELSAATDDGRPLVGLFADYEIPYVLDGLGDAPTLASMTEVAIDRLSADPDGFFLMVEGARIDHASHAKDVDRVHPETAAFDEAIGVGIDWAARLADATVLVTADHECGGLWVADTGAVGVTPESSYRWGRHTNADAPVFATGPTASVLDGQRLDSRWVHQVLRAAIEETAVEPPEDIGLPDGWMDDLGESVSTQSWDTSYDPGYAQLDGLYLTADETGLRVGIDGAYALNQDALVVYLDIDYGDDTGLGGDGTAFPDMTGTSDSILSTLDVSVDIEGLGFDLAVVSVGAHEVEYEDFDESSGIRGLREPWAYEEDLWWLHGAVNFDDGNVAINDEAAEDAGATGLTEGGFEAWVPWDSIYPDGMPGVGFEIAAFAVIVEESGEDISNQTLPPLPDDAAPGSGTLNIESVAVLTVDADGVAMGEAVVE